MWRAEHCRVCGNSTSSRKRSRKSCRPTSGSRARQSRTAGDPRYGAAVVISSHRGVAKAAHPAPGDGMTVDRKNETLGAGEDLAAVRSMGLCQPHGAQPHPIGQRGGVLSPSQLQHALPFWRRAQQCAVDRLIQRTPRLALRSRRGDGRMSGQPSGPACLPAHSTPSITCIRPVSPVGMGLGRPCCVVFADLPNADRKCFRVGSCSRLHPSATMHGPPCSCLDMHQRIWRRAP